MRFEPISRKRIIDVSDIRSLRSSHTIANKIAVDRVLDGCFQLLSLFFMTIGRNNEAPAAYALTSTIKRLLEHLTQVDIYSAKDLNHVTHTLKNLRNVVETADSGYSPTLITLLSNRLDVCQNLLNTLISRLDRLKGDLPKVHEKLISILRSLSLANTKSKVSLVDIRMIPRFF
jgi:hypothetical protein